MVDELNTWLSERKPVNVDDFAFATDSGRPAARQGQRSRAVPLPYVMDRVGRADSKTTLEIYAQVQKRISRKNVHAAFDRLLNGADSVVVSGQL